jgi:hypothetical protein
MNTRFLTILTTLAFLGFSISAFAGKVVKCPTWPECEGVTITYTAQLFGEFVFNTSSGDDDIVDVTEVAEGDLRSGESLLMFRPGGDGNTWDQVFDACAALLEPGSVTSISVASADWSIEKAGGVRVVFRDIRLKLKGTTEDVLVRVQLIGDEHDFFESYLPAPGDTRVYELNQFDIMGTTAHGVHPRSKCHEPGRDGPALLTPSTLVITAEQPQP